MQSPKIITVAALALSLACCKQSDEPESTTPIVTTRPAAVATRPQPDRQAIVKDRTAATQPEDAKSTPVGEIKKVTLADGLVIEDLRIGKGDVVGKNAKIHVVYVGWLDDGTIFDDSRPGGVPVAFEVGKGGVIKGWDEGIPGMKLGGIRLLTVPAPIGYGDQVQAKIPAKSTLHFRIQMVRAEPE